MRTLRRLKFMSSPSLSDLGKREPAAAAADERGTQQRRACANATWNSIHNGVIAVFQRKGLPDQELFSLNEGVRQLLKTELGSFFTEYLQNQLLTKGMVILRDKIRFYEGQKLLDSLAETWDFFFSDVLPTLQAIFYPVQGKEPSVRQLALLHFRNTITLSVKLEGALARTHARVPPAIVQMLLVLQGVHESRGVTKDYLCLETLIQKVVSPYLGTYGLHSSEGPFTHSCMLGKADQPLNSPQRSPQGDPYPSDERPVGGKPRPDWRVTAELKDQEEPGLGRGARRASWTEGAEARGPQGGELGPCPARKEPPAPAPERPLSRSPCAVLPPRVHSAELQGPEWEPELCPPPPSHPRCPLLPPARGAHHTRNKTSATTSRGKAFCHPASVLAFHHFLTYGPPTWACHPP
ncbi:proline-rich protein 5, partial [Herpailurus yagouaroundi]|uniref:proline-rich protein 5 n=1 Tax=Herpailurus yagouaroundi TaxID=1608482 RepID=UPI001AD793B4